MKLGKTGVLLNPSISSGSELIITVVLSNESFAVAI
jgi:hypothetical protein